jgi:hypothetical protein
MAWRRFAGSGGLATIPYKIFSGENPDNIIVISI